MQKLEHLMSRDVSCGKREQEIPPRRVVLRGALAVGCSLWVPMLLSGCDSKKGADSPDPAPAGPPATSPAPAAPPATGAKPDAPAAAKKVAQATVQYQPQPKGDQKCSGCVHFIAESNACKLVDGQISPEGWCSLWAKKA
jgi:hypothetical protein